MPGCTPTASSAHCRSSKKAMKCFRPSTRIVAWYINAPNLILIDIKDIIYGIINEII